MAPPVTRRLSLAGEPVTLAVGDAIFLPAIPIDEVDDEAPIVFANPGSEAVTARSFHTHQEDGTFYGYLPGLTLGDWDMAGPFDPATIEAMAGTDVLFRLSRSPVGLARSCRPSLLRASACTSSRAGTWSR